MPIDLPTPGKPGKPKINKWWLIGGGAGVVFVFIQYRKARANLISQQAAGESADAAAMDATNAMYGQSGGDGSAVGSPYGSLANLTWNPDTGRYQSADDNSAPDWESIDPTTNQQWADKAQQFLTGIGFDPMFVAQSLGKYITGGSTLTDNEMSAIQAAQARIGGTPVQVPDSNLGGPAQTFEDWARSVIGAPGSTYVRNPATGTIFQNYQGKTIALNGNEWGQVLAKGGPIDFSEMAPWSYEDTTMSDTNTDNNYPTGGTK